jgi:N6-L-threonylcarbamoyladenine synthase
MEVAEEPAGAAGARSLVVAGGVAANRRLRSALETLARMRGASFHAPPVALCGDNAAMVAWTGAVRLEQGLCDGLDFAARARWPLDVQAVPAIGAGRLGAKA